VNKSIEELDGKMETDIGLTNESSDELDDKMAAKMAGIGTAFYKEGNAKNENGCLSKAKFRNVVKKYDCVRELLEMRFSEKSTLPGWAKIYEEIKLDGGNVPCPIPDGGDGFSEAEVVGIFKKRGSAVMEEAKNRATDVFAGMDAGSSASKTKVKAYLKKQPSEKRFLKVGKDKGLSGWQDLFGRLGAADAFGKTVEFTESAMISLYKHQALHAYAGDCLDDKVIA
jgi:hypothetical protein